jgi:hypothetical protein
VGSKLEVIITASTTGLRKELNSATKDVSTFGKGMNVASKVAGAALLGLTAVGVAGFREMAANSKVAGQTAAAIKSTGGAANVTTGQVKRLADSIEAYSGMDAAAIQSGQNLLLTFTKVRNEAGKGNDIFNQTTRIMADMATRMDGDTKGAAIQLGKALNDPIKGVSALGEVGVTFTDAQKDLIASLVKSGDTVGAQKVILAELNTEFGGSAKAAGETLPGKLARLRNGFDGVAETLATGLLPGLEGLIGLGKDATAWMNEHGTATKVASVAVVALGAAIITINAVTKAWAATSAAAGVIQSLFITKTAIATVATQQQAIAQTGLNYAMRANPIGIVITAIALLGTAFVIAWQKSETFRAVVKASWDAIKTAAGAVANFVVHTIPAAFQSVLGWVRANWPKIATIISGPFAPLVALATNAFGVRSGLVGAFRFVLGFTRGVISSIVGWFARLPGQLGSMAASAGRAFVDRLRGGLSSLGSMLASAVKAPINAVIRAWNGVGIPSFGVHIPIPGAPDINFNTPSVSLPDIPQLAQGGIVDRPTLALIGEAGPEAVVPLSSGRMGGDTYHFHLPNYLGSPQEVAEIIRAELIKMGRRMPGVLGGL